MKILVGIDGFSHSYEALEYAIGEAKIKNTKLTVVLSRREERTGEDAIRDREFLERAQKMMRDKGIEPDSHLLVRGFSPAVDIVKFAEDNSYEHIIEGSHGRSGITRIILGSVVDEVVHKAHCPVTVFRK
ncbi:MAG: universal stress protein [Candidatus Heimdallarchaeota archaeon]